MKYKEKIIHMLKSPALEDLWFWSKESHGAVLLMCLFSFLTSCCGLTMTISSKGLIDGAVNHKGNQLWFYGIVMAAVVLITRGIALLSRLYAVRTRASLLNRIRFMVFGKMLRKQYSHIHHYHSGELVNRIFSDVGIVSTGIMDIVPELVNMSVSFIGASVILIRMDWHLVVVLILGALLGAAVILVLKQPMKRYHKSVQEAEDKFHAVTQETLENLRLIKASGSEQRMERQMSSRQNILLEKQVKRGNFSAYMNSGIGLIFQSGWLFCMLWGAYGIYQGQFTFGMLTAMLQLVSQIQGPIARAAEVVGRAYGTISSAERLKEIIGLPEEDDFAAADQKEKYEDFEEIVFRNLEFSYGRETEPVLKDVNLQIKSKDFIAVTGISGEGKSTLFQLLLGIYAPTKGELSFKLCLGRQNTEEVQASKRTRFLFAYVPQGNTLFSGTLRENLCMFTDKADEQEILEAARTACIDGLIDELDAGLDTVLGERGIGLSEGQAQRVAVARALLSNAPVLLLDESTSALDEETEAKLLKNIALLKEKTCLIVTHRKAALDICDYRIHIENGNVYQMSSKNIMAD